MSEKMEEGRRSLRKANSCLASAVTDIKDSVAAGDCKLGRGYIESDRRQIVDILRYVADMLDLLDNSIEQTDE